VCSGEGPQQRVGPRGVQQVSFVHTWNNTRLTAGVNPL
jgi:hypothetical protein